MAAPFSHNSSERASIQKTSGKGPRGTPAIWSPAVCRLAYHGETYLSEHLAQSACRSKNGLTARIARNTDAVIKVRRRGGSSLFDIEIRRAIPSLQKSKYQRRYIKDQVMVNPLKLQV